VRFRERLVGGDRNAVLLFSLSENLEEHLGAPTVEFEIAEFVDLQKVDASVAGDGLAELFVVSGLDELVHQAGRCGEVALLARRLQIGPQPVVDRLLVRLHPRRDPRRLLARLGHRRG
jgi:hypothetical protein